MDRPHGASAPSTLKVVEKNGAIKAREVFFQCDRYETMRTGEAGHCLALGAADLENQAAAGGESRTGAA
jgi:hypothetical protein